MKHQEKPLDMIMTILREGGISNAARKMYLSQPALRQRISILEKKLGFQIFRRDITPMELTYEGNLYIKMLLDMEELEQNFSKQILEISQGFYGTISLGLTSMRAQQLLPRLLPLLKEQLPHLELKFFHGNNRAELNRLLEERKVDFIINSQLNPDFIQEELFSSILIAAVPLNHPLAITCKGEKHWSKKPPITLKEFENETFILNYEGQGGRIMTDRVFQMYHFTPSKTIEIFDYYTMTQLVQEQIGVALLPSSNIAYLYDNLSVCFFNLTQTDSMCTYLSYRKTLYLSPLIKRFIELCKSPQIWMVPEK